MNADLLIHSIVQQAMVFAAQLATAGGARVPLASLANRVFLDLASELRHQGLKHSVIADMFGITLRTYHRRVRELEQSHTVEGSTVWEAVLGFLRENEPVTAARVHQRFALDDQDVVAGVLSDLVSSGLVYGSGRGKSAVYRIADQADCGPEDEAERNTAKDYLVWHAVYRRGPLSDVEVAEATGLGATECVQSLARLVNDGRIQARTEPTQALYTSDRLDVPVVVEYAAQRLSCRRCGARCVELLAWADPYQRQTRRLQQHLALDAFSMPLVHVSTKWGLSAAPPGARSISRI